MGHRGVKVRASGASASPVLSPSQAAAAPALSRQAFLEAGPLGCQLPGCEKRRHKKNTDLPWCVVLVRATWGRQALEGDAT